MAEPDCRDALIADLREAVRARDEFLSIAAHELRNPMHALLLQTTSTLRAARRAGDPVVIDKVERIVAVLERYVRRANSLLDVSRVNAGQLQLHATPVDLAEIVREVVTSYQPEADYNKAPITLSLPPSLTVEADRTAIDQIVANLVSNAIKYGAGAPVTVSLCAENGIARLTVADSGIGIPPAEQSRIFERFEQVMTGSPRAGFGIGLWLARSLVEAHGGAIRVESRENQGSTFEVHLPVEPPARSAPEQ